MKTTHKLSFRRPLFAMLPLLLGLSSVSAAPRAGVVVGYTGRAILAMGDIPATTMKDFFFTCPNDAGESAFVALGANGKRYLLSNGGLGSRLPTVNTITSNGTGTCTLDLTRTTHFWLGHDEQCRLLPPQPPSRILLSLSTSYLP